MRKSTGDADISDNTEVFGNDNTHDLHLHEAKERTRRAGIKFNYDKCITKSTFCSFSGNVYTSECVKKMEPPPTKQELQSFLGMAKYLISCIPHMSDLTSNLRNLLWGSLFQWTEKKETEFQLWKKAITKVPNLQYLNPKKTSDSSGRCLPGRALSSLAHGLPR